MSVVWMLARLAVFAVLLAAAASMCAYAAFLWETARRRVR